MWPADLTDIHSYPDPMISLKMPGKARVLGEFGGIGVIYNPITNGYPTAPGGYVNEKPAGLKAKYSIMNKHLQLVAKGGIKCQHYTQPFDVEGEQNGLITYDREVVKIPFKELQKIHQPLNSQIGNLPAVTAIDADIAEPGELYAALLQEYLDGKNDPAFIKQLAMRASTKRRSDGREQV